MYKVWNNHLSHHIIDNFPRILKIKTSFIYDAIHDFANKNRFQNPSDINRFWSFNGITFCKVICFWRVSVWHPVSVRLVMGSNLGQIHFQLLLMWEWPMTDKTWKKELTESKDGLSAVIGILMSLDLLQNIRF